MEQVKRNMKIFVYDNLAKDEVFVENLNGSTVLYNYTT